MASLLGDQTVGHHYLPGGTGALLSSPSTPAAQRPSGARIYITPLFPYNRHAIVIAAGFLWLRQGPRAAFASLDDDGAKGRGRRWHSASPRSGMMVTGIPPVDGSKWQRRMTLVPSPSRRGGRPELRGRGRIHIAPPPAVAWTTAAGRRGCDCERLPAKVVNTRAMVNTSINPHNQQ